MSDAPKRPDSEGPEVQLDDRQRGVLQSLRAAVKVAPVPVRSCGECAKCCEGWLSGTVYGHAFSPGRPCFFLEKTCSIYPDRPVDPCRNYRCSWLAEEIFPMWMKPSLSNVIITRREDEASKLPYYIADVAGEAFDGRAATWLLQWAAETKVNLEYRLNGEVQRLGAPEFVNGK
jgi:hypothetical protein